MPLFIQRLRRQARGKEGLIVRLNLQGTGCRAFLKHGRQHAVVQPCTSASSEPDRANHEAKEQDFCMGHPGKEEQHCREQTHGKPHAVRHADGPMRIIEGGGPRRLLWTRPLALPGVCSDPGLVRRGRVDAARAQPCLPLGGQCFSVHFALGKTRGEQPRTEFSSWNSHELNSVLSVLMTRTLARRFAACMCAVVMLPMSKGFSLSPPACVGGICHVSPGRAPRHYVDTVMKARGGKGQSTTNAKGFGAPPFNTKAAPQAKAAAPAPPSTTKAPLQARAAAVPLLQH
jgi:hypothetical protein